MADFIISPYAISFNSIKNALQTYIQNKSDVTSTWTDFYAAGAGQTILELDAAIASFYAFHFIVGRRESYLPTAENYSSIVGGAEALGYNCSRGHNVYLSIKIVPNTSVTLPKWTVIGSYDQFDIVLLNDVILNKDEATTINCVIGNSQVQSIGITSSELQQFIFTAENTTDDCRLILNDTVVPFTTEIKDAMNDNYIMLSNPYGCVDVFYLNSVFNARYKYKENDTLYLHYIERNNIQFGNVNLGILDIEYASQVEEVNCIEDRTDEESANHIKLAAPIFHETNNTVRARKDYVKYLIQNNKFIVDANDKDINPGLIALTYLKEDTGEGTSLLTSAERQAYLNSLIAICPDGVATPFIENPVRVVRNLSISLWKKTDENIPASIEDDIDAILGQYKNKLSPKLDLEQIENELEQLPGVKIARVDLGVQDYQLDTKYKLYDVVTVPKILVGNTYETWTFFCSKIQAKTGSTEPDWATASNVGDTVTDNNLIWENSNKYANTIPAKWKQNGKYELYSDINVGYTIPGYCTKQTEPDWNAVTVGDGNVTWNRCKAYDYVLPDYEPDTKFSLDEQAIAQIDKSYKAVYTVKEVTHKTSAKAPNWNSLENLEDEIIDNAITWKFKYIPWTPNTEYKESAQVAVDVNGKLYVYNCLLEHTSSETCPLDGSANITLQIGENEETVWVLVDTIETFTTWQPSTEMELNSYVKVADKYLVSTNITNTRTGNSVEWKKDGLLQKEVVDNNIVWVLDTYFIEYEEFNCMGLDWKAESPYSKNDIIIVKNDVATFVYQAFYVNPQPLTVQNTIYSVVNYAGVTSLIEPGWGEDNVIDNDILWTKTANPSQKTWKANTEYRFGDIITTDAGYYVFSSVLGTSGMEDPNWAGIKNNIVEDNNITWQRLNSTTSFFLRWNEYLDLKYTYRIIG